MTSSAPRGLTYADAGVDIDAGNAMVEPIKPLVRATRRPGADAEIGGFGGLFDLKAAGFRDPVLVAANDGVGTKVKIAIESGIYDTIGDRPRRHVRQRHRRAGRRAAVLPRLFRDRQARSGRSARRSSAGIARGCVESGCALIGGETAEMPGLYARGDFDLAGFAVGAAERGTLLPRAGLKAGDVAIGLPSSGVHSNGFSLVRRIVAHERPCLGRAGAVRAGALARRRAADADAALRQAAAGGAEGRPTGVLALAHVTGGGFPDNLPRVLPDDLAVELDLDAFAPPPVFGWLARAGGVSESGNAAHLQLRLRHGRLRRRGGGRRCRRRAGRGGSRAGRIGRLAPRDGERVVMRGRLKL